jgi:hypothetical protein
VSEQGLCPYCGLTIVKNDESQTIAHQAPVCATFMTLMYQGGGEPEVKAVAAKDLPALFEENASKLHGDGIAFRCDVQFICPFCSQMCKAGESKRPDEPDGESEPCVMHMEPTCETYDRLDALAFMEAVNAAIRARKLVEKPS